MDASTISASEGLIIHTGRAALLKRLVHRAFRRMPAEWYWRFLAWRFGRFDPEMNLLGYLCEPDKCAVDVGASNGGYTVHLLQHAGSCLAVEPRPGAAATLARTLRAVPGSRLRVEAVALSDRNGEAQLRVVTAETGRSTIEAENPVDQIGMVETVTVPMRCLDNYAGVIGPVCLIKIDVEGHEESVLRGAASVLRRDHPSLLIEVEERHKRGSIAAVNRFLGEFGYRGFFYRGGRLHPIESFDPVRQQDIATIAPVRAGVESAYINNFVFLAAEPLARVRHLLMG